MAATRRRYSKAVLAERGEAMFAEQVRDHVKTADKDAYVVIDIETGGYEVDAEELAACRRLRARLPQAQIWVRRIGQRVVRHFGGRARPVDE